MCIFLVNISLSWIIHSHCSLSFTCLSLTGHPFCQSELLSHIFFDAVLNRLLVRTEVKKKKRWRVNLITVIHLNWVGLSCWYSIHITQIYLPQKYNTPDQTKTLLTLPSPALFLTNNHYYQSSVHFSNPFPHHTFESLITINHMQMSRGTQLLLVGWINM